MVKNKFLEGCPVIEEGRVEEKYKDSYIYSKGGDYPMAVVEEGESFHIVPMEQLMAHISECLGFEESGAHKEYENLKMKWSIDESTCVVDYVYRSGEEEEGGKYSPKSVYALASLMKMEFGMIEETCARKTKARGG